MSNYPKIRKSPGHLTEEHRRRLSESVSGYSHTEEARRRMSAAHLGVPLAKEHRESLAKSGKVRFSEPEERKQLREAGKRHAALNLPDCRCFAHQRNNPTDIEVLLVDRILGEFPEIKTQQQFGVYHVDAYLPLPYHLAFEADGEHWHRHPKRDVARDAYLQRKFGVPVVRLMGSEIKEACIG